MLVLILSAILCCVVCAWWSLRPRRCSPPVLPGALPFIGHAHQAMGDRKHLWNFLRKTQMRSLAEGGLIEFWLGPHSVYLVTDPDDTLMLCNTCLDRPYIYGFARDLLNSGLVTTHADLWKSKRKLLNPSFNQQVLNTYVNEMNVQARSLASQLASKVGKDPFDVRKHFIDYTLSTVTRTMLGLNTQDQTAIDTDYAEAIDSLFTIYCDRFQKVWLHLSFIFKWSAMKRKQDQLTNKLKNIMNPVIRNRKIELNADKYQDMINDKKPDKFKPVLDQLLHLSEEQDAFTDDEIREHLDTLVAAAYDTTSSTLTIVLLAIGSYQDVQERVFNELLEVLEHKDDDLTKNDLPKLEYMEAVIKEVMRLYPSIPLFGRKINEDIKMKNCTLRSGSTLMIGVHGLLRHPMWGPDTEQFKPERWLQPDSLPDHPSINAAFGLGKRNCIGKVYATMVMKVALAHILRRYHVTSDIKKVVCQFDVVLKPVEGHQIGFTLRT